MHADVGPNLPQTIQGLAPVRNLQLRCLTSTGCSNETFCAGKGCKGVEHWARHSHQSGSATPRAPTRCPAGSAITLGLSHTIGYSTQFYSCFGSSTFNFIRRRTAELRSAPLGRAAGWRAQSSMRPVRSLHCIRQVCERSRSGERAAGKAKWAASLASRHLCSGCFEL